MYLRDDGRTRHGKLVTPDEPAGRPSEAAPSEPSETEPSAGSSAAIVQVPTLGGDANEALPIAPLHLWRDFSGPLVYKPVDVSGTPFPWPPRSERVPSSWRQFASFATAETHMGNANGDGGQERDGDDDKDKDEEMSEGDEEDGVDEDEHHTANDDKVSKKK